MLLWPQRAGVAGSVPSAPGLGSGLQWRQRGLQISHLLMLIIKGHEPQRRALALACVLIYSSTFHLILPWLTLQEGPGKHQCLGIRLPSLQNSEKTIPVIYESPSLWQSRLKQVCSGHEENKMT